MPILLPHKVDLKNIIVEERKSSKSKIKYKAGDNKVEELRIQTPMMRIPWDTRPRVNQNGKVYSQNLCVSTYEMFDDKNKKRVRQFRSITEDIEKAFSMDSHDNLQLSSVIYAKDPKYDPVINMSIPCKDAKPCVVVYDDTKEHNVLDFKEIHKGTICSLVVHFSHFWSTDTKYGINLIVDQIKVHKPALERVELIEDTESGSESD